MKKISKLFAISQSVQTDIFDRYKIKSTLIYNGIDFNKIKKRTDFSIKSKVKIIQISRLDHLQKGQDILMQAVNWINSQMHTPLIELYFIGEGRSRHYLEKLMHTLGMSCNCYFLGKRDRNYIYANLCDFHLLVQPSLVEGFGLTVVEGIAANIPVLVSDSDGPMEIIQNGEFGYCFKNGNAMDCAEQILSIINNYNELRSLERISKSFIMAKNKFSIEKTSRSYYDAYRDLCL